MFQVLNCQGLIIKSVTYFEDENEDNDIENESENENDSSRIQYHGWHIQ